MSETKTVRSMGARQREAPPEAVRQGRAEPKRVLVNQTPRSGGGGKQYAERIFDVPATRGGEVDAAEANVSEVAEGPALLADRQEGGPIVMESDRVLGRQGPVRAAPRGGASARSVSGGARRRPGAQWQGSEGRTQDMVVAPNGTAVEEGTVRQDQLITRQEPGPQTPTGEPCTCVFEWEETEDAIEVYTKADPGMATGLRGAPSWMTWCVVCGGERDGQFRPENAIRYGNAIPEAQPAVDVEALEARISDVVMDQVASYLGSERFMKGLAKTMAETMKAAKE